MAVTFRVSLDGDPGRLLKAARARGQDLRPALRAMAAAGVTQTKRRFNTKRAPDGSAWRPTRKIGGTTLVHEGYLQRSISARPPSETAVEWGSNRVYAGIHQTGGTIRAKDGGYLRFRVGGNGGWTFVKQVNIPARPYLGTNAADMAAFAKIALRHVGEPLGGGAG